MATFLVTGGGGFIGSNIVIELVKLGERVKVLDNFSTGRIENLMPLLDKIELIEGSITDLETVRFAVRDVDYVLHQAALPSVPRSIEQPLISNEVNVVGTLNVLIASRDANVKRVIYASSSSVYGNTEVLPKVETMKPEPISPYAVSKLTGEYYCRVFYEVYGLETVSLRYFNVFGPNQNPFSQYSAVIPKFILALTEGKRPIIYGDGLQSRDFTFVKNVVEANLLAVNSKDAPGKVFNIACQETHNLLELINVLNEIMNKQVEPVFLPPRKGDVKHSLADISLARKVLGYSPRVNWEEGLKITVEWFTKNIRMFKK